MEGLRPEDPQRVGRYRLLRRLGSGSMGQVYLGQSRSGRLVAVKVVRAELADNANFRQRFRQEVTAARRVSGIFTAPVVDADPDAREPWMVTAFVSGPSLSEAVASRGPMPVSTVLILAAGLAEGLSAVHAAGVVHRDLKPSNVLLASDGPRIIDFGISRSVGSVGPTRAGGIIGSPGFMSPEQAMGEPVGPPADIFSLGSVLAYASTGEPPFGDGPPSTLLYRAVHGEPAIKNVPPEVRPLVARCMLADPAARPTTDELLGELGEVPPTQAWLDWLGISAVASWQGPNTVPSQAWDGAAGLSEQSGDQLPSDPAGPDDDVVPSVPAEAEPEVAPAHIREEPDVAAFGTGSPSRPPTDAGTGSAELAPSPARSLSWVFPDSGAASSRAAASRLRRDRARSRVGMVAVGVLGVAILTALAVWLVPRFDPNLRAAGSSAAPTAGLVVPLTPGQIQALPALERTDVRVVLAYYEAINSGHLKTAWQLGGDNLYRSTNAGLAAWKGVTHVRAAILGVHGDFVRADVTITRASGTVLRTLGFIVRDGVIKASRSVTLVAARQ